MSRKLQDQLNFEAINYKQPMILILHIKSRDLLYLIENTFDGKRIYANPSSYPNPKHNSNFNPNTNPNPKAQLCFRTDEMTSFFDDMYRYLNRVIRNWFVVEWFMFLPSVLHDEGYSRRRSNVLRMQDFDLPKPNQILFNLSKFTQILPKFTQILPKFCPNLPKKFARSLSSSYASDEVPPSWTGQIRHGVANSPAPL